MKSATIESIQGVLKDDCPFVFQFSLPLYDFHLHVHTIAVYLSNYICYLGKR